MKTARRFGSVLLSLLLLCALWAPAGATAPVDTLTVLFTHDTHDHFYPDAADVGGYTRLATLLKEERAQAEGAVVTLDAGDFSMGSLFQTVYATDAPELRALGAMGYDAVTLGNHEFDYRPQGLAAMLTAAKSSGDPLPAIVQANYKTPKDDSAQIAVQAMADYPVTDYTVLERAGLKIAVFGVMGVDSDECAPMSGMTLEPLVEAAQRVVDEIQSKEHPDFLICLSHSGTENGKGEDYELAKQVKGIDLILSGHTHTTLAEPIVVNDSTYIVSCGPYTQNLGKITLTKTQGNETGLCEVKEYELIPIDHTIPPDDDLEALARRFQTQVNQTYLASYGLSYDQPLTRSVSDFTIPQTGDLIGAAYLSTVQALEGENYIPIAFAVAPDGVIRDTIRQGEVTTSNAFDILSLGSGADGSPGYPLVSVYLTGKDLKNAFEVDASISALMPAATLYGAGSLWSYNPHRMFLDRVTRSVLTTEHQADRTGDTWSLSWTESKIEDDQLYRVVADLYSGQMLGAVKSKSFGLLSITPRDEAGNEITDFEARILHDAQGNEVKAWYALASYLNSQSEVDPQKVAPSKMELRSWNPVDLLIPMGLPTALVLAVLLLVVVLVLLIVRAVRHRGRTRNGYRPYRGK